MKTTLDKIKYAGMLFATLCIITITMMIGDYIGRSCEAKDHKVQKRNNTEFTQDDHQRIDSILLVIKSIKKQYLDQIEHFESFNRYDVFQLHDSNGMLTGELDTIYRTTGYVINKYEFPFDTIYGEKHILHRKYKTK